MAILSAEPITEISDFVPRKGDAQECMKLGLPPEAAVLQSAASSLESWVIRMDGKVVATWGYGMATVMSNWCFAWLLTTDEIEPYRYRLARTSINVIGHLLQRFEGVRVMVDREYGESVQWLEWLGFRKTGVWEDFDMMFVTRESFPWALRLFL